MNLDLFQHELNVLDQALGYAVIYAKTEEETAEFAMLKVKVSTAIETEKELAMKKELHSKMNCPYQYCSQNPKCKETCFINKQNIQWSID
jgi:hypothetical protein